MSGNGTIGRPVDRRAGQIVSELMGARGWTPRDVEERSRHAGHPDRVVSERTVYRVINEGYVPLTTKQFEIAAVFGLVPPHIWGRLPIPEHRMHGLEVVPA